MKKNETKSFGVLLFITLYLIPSQQCGCTHVGNADCHVAFTWPNYNDDNSNLKIAQVAKSNRQFFFRYAELTSLRLYLIRILMFAFHLNTFLYYF